MKEEYDIEPFMPAVSPGAPVPAPKYVPFNHSKLTPGNYFAHSTGASDSVFGMYGKPKDWGSTRPPANVLENIYRHGVRVQNINGPDSSLRATAWNYKVEPKHLSSPDMKKQTLSRMGHPEGLANNRYKSNPLTGSKKIEGSNFIKPRRGAWGSGYEPPVLPRTKANAGLNTVIMKGEPSMFHKKGPNFIPRNSTSGNINRKTIIGHFPKGSDQMVTPASRMQKAMPTLRGLGGAGIDMFFFPSIPGSKPPPTDSHDLWGRPIPQPQMTGLNGVPWG